MSSVHNLTDKVSEIIPWHFTATTGTFHVVLEDDGGVTEISLREGVSHVESLGSELSALTHDRVEVAETEQDSPDLGITIIKLLLLVHSDSTLHVGLESCWGLVSKLDGSLKQVDGDILCWVRRQEKSEGLVRSFNGEGIELLKHLIQEIRHEMDVLKHNPLAFFVSHFEEVHGDDVLTLTEGNLVELLSGIKTEALGQTLYVLNRIGSRRKNKEYGSHGARVSVRRGQNLFSTQGVIAFDETLTVG